MIDNINLDLRRGRMALQAVIALAVVLVVGLVAFSGDSQAANKKLRIAYTVQPGNIPIVLAQEQGFYKKNGLDVKLTPQLNANQALGALGKQFDISNGTVGNLVGLAASGFGPKLLIGNDFANKSHSTTALMVKKGITSYKQLKGQRIGIVAVGQGAQYAATLIALGRAGLTKKDVKFVVVPFASMVDQMKAGRIDAAVAIEPYVTQLKGTGLGFLGDPLLSVHRTVPGTIWIGNGKAIKKDPAKYKAFYKAYTQTVAWMKTHDKEWRQAIISTFKLNAFAAARYVYFPYVDLTVSPSVIQPWVKPMERYGLIKKGKVKNVKSLIFKP